MTLYAQPRAEVFASSAPPSEIQPFEAWLRGLGIAFDETNGYPEMTGLNGLFNALNLYIKYLEQNGFAEWRSDMEYPQGAGVRVGLVWYRAKLQNTNKPPATSQTEWELFLNASALSYQEPLYIDGNTIKIRDASTTVKGVTQFANSVEVNNKSNVSKAITPFNVVQMFGQQLTTSGFSRLPNGTIEQWATVKLSAVGAFNQQIIGGQTYYTHYYQVPYPIPFSTSVFTAVVSLACANGLVQAGMAGQSVTSNLNGWGDSLNKLTVAVTTTILGQTPTIHMKATGI